jgi:hypothetical protein
MKDYWNYRILAKRTKSNKIEFGFYEVYYENDIPISCTNNPIPLLSYSDDYDEPIKSLKWQLEAMKLASEKPILDYDFFPKEYKAYYRKIKLKNIQDVMDKLESALEEGENSGIVENFDRTENLKNLHAKHLKK